MKDLIHSCPFDKVAEKIALHYGNEYIDDYRRLYEWLLTAKASEDQDMSIHIAAVRESGHDYIPADDFDEDDTSLYFDVSGFDSSSPYAYSIVASAYCDFLGFGVDSETLEKFSPESIIAHCLDEMTFFGFDTDRSNIKLEDQQ